VAIGATTTDANGTLFSAVGRAWRLRNDGTAFPGYATSSISGLGPASIYADGSIVYSGYQLPGPIRLTPAGATDLTFTGGIGRVTAIAAGSDGKVYVGGAFILYNGKSANRIARLNTVANGAVNAPQILDVVADKTTVKIGEAITVSAAVIGSADLTYEWSGAAGIYPNDTVRTASPVFTFAFTSTTAQAHTLRLTVYNPRGQATTTPIAFDVEPAPPVVTPASERVSAQSGRDLTLAVQVNDDAGQLEYRWERNGQNVSPPEWWLNGPALYLPHVGQTDAGTYILYVRNVLGATSSSPPIVVTIDDSSRFANLSTRAFVGAGEQTMIAGFTVPGASARTLLIRGVGPGLARFGVPAPLANPRITLYRGTTATGYWSEDWNANGNENIDPIFAKVGAFPLDPASKDAVIIPTLAPGSYTVQLEAKPGQSGTALIEIYEDDNDAARIVNLSTRATVEPGAPAICGFSIQGLVAKRVLLRASGPALGAFGIAGTLANPRLTLTDARGAIVARNDDWESNANAGEVRAAMSASGAFPFATGAKDAAVVATLQPGNYTMVVEGAAATDQGVVLLETYELP
jgi:hypothetical protein